MRSVSVPLRITQHYCIGAPPLQYCAALGVTLGSAGLPLVQIRLHHLFNLLQDKGELWPLVWIVRPAL